MTRPTTRLSAPAFERLARSIMADNGLFPEWSFEWGRATGRIGCCVWSTRTLRFSKPAFTGATYQQGFDTITHEVAHALAGASHGHDDVWKAIHARLGGSSERLWTDVAEFGPSLATKRRTARQKRSYDFVGVCPGCGREEVTWRRSRGACARCCDRAGGGYHEEFAIVWWRVVDGVRVAAPLPPR